MSSRKNTGGYGVKQEMSGEKTKKSQKTCLLFMLKYCLKLLQLFWFVEVEFDPYIYRQ